MPVAERLFLALWPPDGVRRELTARRQALALTGGRLIAPANLHATLVFLGDVDPSRRGCIEQAASTVRATAFEFTLTEVEWRRKTGIAWLAAPPPPPLLEMVGALQNALAACQVAPVRHPYRLHVTLARDVTHGPRRQAIAPIRWEAKEFCLVSSRLTPGGSEYTVVRRWPLT